MAYTMDARRFGQAMPKPKYTISVKDMAMLRRIAGTHPDARRRVADATPDQPTFYQPAAKVDARRAAIIGGMGRVPEIPAMTVEEMAEQERRMANGKKLREQRDAAMARSQSIADGMKDAVRKIWPNAWGRK